MLFDRPYLGLKRAVSINVLENFALKTKLRLLKSIEEGKNNICVNIKTTIHIFSNLLDLDLKNRVIET